MHVLSVKISDNKIFENLFNSSLILCCMHVPTYGWMNSAILIHFSQAFESDIQVVKNFRVTYWEDNYKDGCWFRSAP